ncbi:MAG TPA: hypothetical protein VHE53_00570 [Patescibacteria group bacterium]|nr:hypothetical protein [Patescibacteria group bacterium]
MTTELDNFFKEYLEVSKSGFVKEILRGLPSNVESDARVTAERLFVSFRENRLNYSSVTLFEGRNNAGRIIAALYFEQKQKAGYSFALSELMGELSDKVGSHKTLVPVFVDFGSDLDFASDIASRNGGKSFKKIWEFSPVI